MDQKVLFRCHRAHAFQGKRTFDGKIHAGLDQGITGRDHPGPFPAQTEAMAPMDGIGRGDLAGLFGLPAHRHAGIRERGIPGRDDFCDRAARAHGPDRSIKTIMHGLNEPGLVWRRLATGDDGTPEIAEVAAKRRGEIQPDEIAPLDPPGRPAGAR